MNVKGVIITQQENYYLTTGLKTTIGYELRLLIKNRHEAEYWSLLKYLINYFIDHKPVISPNQTIAYHSWLLKFISSSNNELNLHEANSNGDGFCEGVDYCLGTINDQIQVCTNHNVDVLFPLFSQMIVISDGVLNGLIVDAVRYPSPSHMTGWWLTTELYNNNIETLKTIHYYHLAFNRPDIIKFLALPYGYRFSSVNENEIRFDKDVVEGS